MTSRILATLLTSVTLISTVPAWADSSDAFNHGYETAALETFCAGMLTVTNPKLRAKLDQLYRNPKSRWRSDFLEGYEYVASKGYNPLGLWMTCTGAGNSKWLKLDPAARDILTINMKNYEEEHRIKACKRWPDMPKCNSVPKGN